MHSICHYHPSILLRILLLVIIILNWLTDICCFFRDILTSIIQIYLLNRLSEFISNVILYMGIIPLSHWIFLVPWMNIWFLIWMTTMTFIVVIVILFFIAILLLSFFDYRLLIQLIDCRKIIFIIYSMTLWAIPWCNIIKFAKFDIRLL